MADEFACLNGSHNPKGVFGHVMNVLVVLRQQRRNRRAALASLKRVAEAG